MLVNTHVNVESAGYELVDSVKNNTDHFSDKSNQKLDGEKTTIIYHNARFT